MSEERTEKNGMPAPYRVEVYRMGALLNVTLYGADDKVMVEAQGDVSKPAERSRVCAEMAERLNANPDLTDPPDAGTIALLLGGRMGLPPADQPVEPEADSVPLFHHPHSVGGTEKPHRFADPVPFSSLRRLGSDKKWIWEGYFPREDTVLLSALWKAGKTTLLAHLFRAMQAGGSFCGKTLKPGKVLCVTEESETRWAERRDALGIGDHCLALVRPFLCKPDWRQWNDFLAHLTRCQKTLLADLIVFDTISNLWPVTKENDACQVQTALMPVRQVTGNACLVLVHHLRKGDGQEATGSRGSGAITAFVDVIVELRRFDPSSYGDRRRVLTGIGRYEETPDEVVVELNSEGKGYTAQGTRSNAVANDLSAKIDALLPEAAPGFDSQAIAEQMPAGTRRKKLLAVLKEGVDSGRWHREGDGRKGSPYTWWCYPQTSKNGFCSAVPGIYPEQGTESDEFNQKSLTAITYSTRDSVPDGQTLKTPGTESEVTTRGGE